MHRSAYSACHVLDAFSDDLYGKIIPACAVPVYRKIAGCFPPVSGIGIEYHMNSTDRADLCIRITGADSSREGILALADGDPPSLFDRPEWQPVLLLLRKWADPLSSFYAVLHTMWLEFDMDVKDYTGRLPSVFFDLDREDKLGTAVQLSVLDQVLACLQHPLKPETAELLTQLFGPGTPARLYYAGLLLSRTASPLRICAKNLQPDDMRLFIEKFVYGHSVPWHKKELLKLIAGAGQLILNLDVDDRIRESAGIEVYFDSMSEWKNFFSGMTGLGMCHQEKAAEVLRFPGVKECADKAFRRFAAPVAGKEVRWVEKRLNHVKLSFLPRGGFSMKSYLYACYH